MSARAALRAGLIRAMWFFVVAYLLGLLLASLGWAPAMEDWFGAIVDGWLGMLTVWAPTAACWLAVAQGGPRRPEVTLAAAAVTSFAAGDTYYLVLTFEGGSPAFPSLADLGYLLVYPLWVAALVVTVRRNVRGRAMRVWLDGTVGSLGAASVLAVLLSPVLASAMAGSLSLATCVAVAIPLFDLMLVAAVAGITAVGDLRMGGRWGLLAAGLLVFAATDVVYALQVIAGTYLLGTPVDAGWAVGLALMAMWVDGAARCEQTATRRRRSTSDAATLAVSSVATVAGLAVLVVSARVHLSALAVTLATVTLLAAAARSQLAFRMLARMADLRRQTAATDELTGLPNRQALYDEGPARLREHRRQALLVLDLDKFKEVNDSLGHQAGDQLLVQVGARLCENLREGDTLTRLGGDEFALLLEDTDREGAVDVAAQLRAALVEPFALEDITLHTSATVGIALFPDHGADLSALLRRADIAMYKAKASGHGQHVFSHVDDADDTTRLQTVGELRTALTTGQFVLHYQPKVDLSTGEVHAVEALVRWEHPTRGLLQPDVFLSLVEESGLMPSLTRVVLAHALDQVAQWRRRGQPLTVAVNLSASSLVDSDLPTQVSAMLAARGVPPAYLQVEITEEFLMADREQARAILTRLRGSGVEISVDDFGTGYSSLSYLRDLPIDELKLDRSFIMTMTENDHSIALVSSTIDLAHSLGLRMVAEGVETDVAYAELARLGCDQVQGYYLSPPLPAADLDQWRTSRHPLDHYTEITRRPPSANPG